MPLEIKGLINPTNTSVPTAHLAEIHDGGLEPTDSFTVTKNLTHAVIRNEQITNTSYYANVEPETGWSGLTVTIKVGGVDMSNLYQSGTINIPKVTGNIVITAVAAQAPLSSITATYTQSGTVYDTDTLDSLKSDLVVTANYEDGTSATVSDYTLSGTLAEGTSTITVTYGGKTATFDVVVQGEIPVEYQKVEWVGVENTTQTPTAYVETGIVFNTGDTIHAEMKPFNQIGSWDSPFGTYDTAGGFEVYYQNATTIKIDNVAGKATITDFTIGSDWDTVDITVETTTAKPLNLLVYRQNRYAFSGKIKSFVVSNNGAETHKFIPCYKKSDDTIGFYDSVGRNFYSNTGSGTLIKGNDA